MRLTDPFVVWMLDSLAPLGAVSARRMFGGLGLFRDGRMFGLVADGVLHFKADALTRADYEAVGSAPFSYLRRDQVATIGSYWRVPE